ncbi:peptidoglycan-binding protein [Streptomyces sp. NPDC058751]|uniref:peptidoglycan-binding protein n=1 Tax=Streptomyces sp. NPDC058751 TaxID=3346623 RepID=UPI0036BC5515
MIEPTRVERGHRSDSLAELLRQVREKEGMTGADDSREPAFPPMPPLPPRPVPVEDETEELFPVPGAEDHTGEPPPPLGGEDYTGEPSPPLGGEDYTADTPQPYGTGAPRAYGADTAGGTPAGDGRHGERRPGGTHGPARGGAGLRRAAIALAVAAAGLTGFAAALLVPGAARNDASAGHSPTSPADPAADGASDPDGAGTLREGDSGPEVTALQQRLLRIPNVYDHGSTSGTYDAELTAAVARFQLWYGIRGDESGVYGNDTRAGLESRTAAP